MLKIFGLLFIAYNLCAFEPGNIQMRGNVFKSGNVKNIFSSLVYSLTPPNYKECLLFLDELYKKELSLPDSGVRAERLLNLEKLYKDVFVYGAIESSIELGIFAGWFCFFYKSNKYLYSNENYPELHKQILKDNFMNVAIPSIGYGLLSFTDWPLFQYPRTILAMQALNFLWASRSQFVGIARDFVISYYINKNNQLKKNVENQVAEENQVTEENQVAALKYIKGLMSAVANPMVDEWGKFPVQYEINQMIRKWSHLMLKNPDLFYKWSKTLPGRYIKAFWPEDRKLLKQKLMILRHAEKIEYKDKENKKYPLPIDVAKIIASF